MRQAKWKEEQILGGIYTSYLTSVVRFHSIVVRSVRSSYSIQPFHRSAELYVMKRNFRRREIGWGVRGRDRKGPGGKGMETEELHTWFPPSPWSEVFRAMLVRAARPPARRVESRWQSCPIMRALWDSRSRRIRRMEKVERRPDKAVHCYTQSTHRERIVEYFLIRWLNFCPRVMIAMMTEFQSLNAISISSNYICRNWLNSNKEKFYVRCNLMPETDCVDWN